MSKFEILGRRQATVSTDNVDFKEIAKHTNSMIDVHVLTKIATGLSTLTEIALSLRLKPEVLKAHISPSLFELENDTITVKL